MSDAIPVATGDNETACRYDQADRPCPVCAAHTKGCSRTRDGLQRCRGTPADPAAWTTTRTSAEWTFYRPAEPDRRPATAPAVRPPVDWADVIGRHRREFALPQRQALRAGLAATLGLPESALDLILVGFGRDRSGPYFGFPEADADGLFIGLTRRYANGSKKAAAGGKRGLTLSAEWRDRPGPLFVVEGASDALAMASAGLSCVGRPSSNGGFDLLRELLAGWLSDRCIIVVGENDEKPDGAWPGRDGARDLARRLAGALNRPVQWALPPVGSKDARCFLTAADRGDTPWEARGSAFASALAGDATEVVPPPAADGPNDAADDPHRLAALFLNDFRDPNGRRTLRYWLDQFREWRDGAYRLLPDGDIQGRLTARIRAEFVRLNALAAADHARSGKEGSEPPETRKVSLSLVANVRNALQSLCPLPANQPVPSWLDGTAGPNPAGLVVVRNGLVDLDAFAANRPDCLLAPTPMLFTLNAIPHDFDLTAPRPDGFFNFLNEVQPDDQEAVVFLQEWMGENTVDDTSSQKLGVFLGSGRNGKGVYTRLMTELVGPENVAGPSLSSLGGPFGLQPLLGKSVAVVGDARLTGRADCPMIVERLNGITGEDIQDVARKGLPSVTLKLSARFTILSNELPRLPDSAEAVTRRMLVVRFPVSFFGREDPALLAKLRRELPSVLVWALAGLVRRRARGRFVQPASAAGLLRQLADLASPVGAFVRDSCTVGTGLTVEVDALYAAWRDRCQRDGRREPGSVQWFGQALQAAVPTLTTRRPKQNGERWREYVGLTLSPFGSEEPAGREVVALAAPTADPYAWPVFSVSDGAAVDISVSGECRECVDLPGSERLIRVLGSAVLPIAALTQKEELCSVQNVTTQGSIDNGTCGERGRGPADPRTRPELESAGSSSGTPTAVPTPADPRAPRRTFRSNPDPFAPTGPPAGGAI